MHTHRVLRPLLTLTLLAGCAAQGAGPTPVEEELITSALSGYDDGATVIRVETEDELVDQLSILLEDTYYREPELQEAYLAYLEASGELPIVRVGGAACVAASAQSGARVGERVGELVVDVCRRVSVRFPWSPWAWATALVCTAIDRADIDRAVGRAIGRAVGGALARCGTVPSTVIGVDNVPVIAVPGEEEVAEEEELPSVHVGARPHEIVSECTNDQIADLCDTRPQLLGQLYHSDDACGARSDENRLYALDSCQDGVTRIFGERSTLGLDAYCEGLATLAERAARCQRGREIGRDGCGEEDNGHRLAREKATDLAESCRSALANECPGYDSRHPSFHAEGHTAMYCAPPTS